MLVCFAFQSLEEEWRRDNTKNKTVGAVIVFALLGSSRQSNIEHVQRLFYFPYLDSKIWEECPNGYDGGMKISVICKGNASIVTSDP